jgi:hypothetical protein
MTSQCGFDYTCPSEIKVSENQATVERYMAGFNTYAPLD